MNSPHESPAPKQRTSRHRKTLIQSKDLTPKDPSPPKTQENPIEINRPARSVSAFRRGNQDRITEEKVKKIRPALEKEDRTLEEGAQIYETLKMIPVFKHISDFDEDLTSRFLHPLCARIEYKFVKANTILYLESESSDNKIYILLTGEVNIYKKAEFAIAIQRVMTNRRGQMDETRNLLFDITKRAKMDNAFKFKHLLVCIMTQIENSRRENFVHPNTRPGALASGKGNKYGLLREIITPGKHFGDTAMNTDKNKIFTAITSTDCELLVIRRQEINELIEKIETKRKELEEFARLTIPGVSSITSQKNLQSLVYLIEEVVIPKGGLITKEDEPGEHFYIIKAGECEMFKKIFIGANIENVPISDHETISVKKPIFEDVDIYKSTKGGYIGDEIFINNTGKYHYTTRASSHILHLYKINKNKFCAKATAQVLEKVIAYSQNRLLGFQELLDSKLKPMTKVEQDKSNKRSTSVSYLNRKHLLTEPDKSPRNFPFRPSIKKLTHDLIKKPLVLNLQDDVKLAKMVQGYRGSKVIQSSNHSRNHSVSQSRIQTDNTPSSPNINKIRDFKLNFGYKNSDKRIEMKERLKHRTKSSPYLGTPRTLARSIEERLNSSDSNRSNNSSISFRAIGIDYNSTPRSKSPVLQTTPFSARKFFTRKPSEMFSGLIKAPVTGSEVFKSEKLRLEKILIEGHGKVKVRQVLRPMPVPNNRSLFSSMASLKIPHQVMNS